MKLLQRATNEVGTMAQEGGKVLAEEEEEEEVVVVEEGRVEISLGETQTLLIIGAILPTKTGYLMIWVDLLKMEAEAEEEEVVAGE